MRATDFLTEAFNQPYKGKWEKSESGSYDVLVRLPDGTPLSIMFNNEGDGEWQVEFYRNNSQEVTGEGDAQRIFATVLAAIQQFIKKHKPQQLTFSATKDVEPDQNSESRAKLYNRLVDRYATSWGYDALIDDLGDQVSYELTRLQNEAADLDEMAGQVHGGIRKVLRDKGYKYLGSGIDKQAWLEPGTGQVLIIFGYRKGHKEGFSPDQQMFADWVRYCEKNSNNPHLPRFSGMESFEFNGQTYIQCRMEKLKEASNKIGPVLHFIADYADDLGGGLSYEDVITDMLDSEDINYSFDQIVEYLGGPESTAMLIDTVKTVMQFGMNRGFSIDLHRGNYMERPDGTIVVNDPFVLWLGGSGG